MGNILTLHSIKTTTTALPVLVHCDADPRSPTTAFRRTPLRAIRGTLPDLKDPRSPRCNRTPLRFDADPREPTVGIIRTPVPVADKTLIDPREPTEGLVRTPVPKHRSVRRRLQLGAEADDAEVSDVDVAADRPQALIPDGFVSISLEDSVDDDDDNAWVDHMDGFDSAVEEDSEEYDDEDEYEEADDATESEVAHLLVYRSPMPKLRSVQSARAHTKQFSSRNHDSLRKSMAIYMASPNRHSSPCAGRLVASCPSSPVAA